MFQKLVFTMVACLALSVLIILSPSTDTQPTAEVLDRETAFRIRDLAVNRGVSLALPEAEMTLSQARAWGRNTSLLGTVARRGPNWVEARVSFGTRRAAERLDQTLRDEHLHLLNLEECAQEVSDEEIAMLKEVVALARLMDQVQVRKLNHGDYLSRPWRAQLGCGLEARYRTGDGNRADALMAADLYESAGWGAKADKLRDELGFL